MTHKCKEPLGFFTNRIGEAVTTGSPHSWNRSPTTGLGLSLEAGPSVTGVKLLRNDFLGGIAVDIQTKENKEKGNGLYT